MFSSGARKDWNHLKAEHWSCVWRKKKERKLTFYLALSPSFLSPDRELSRQRWKDRVGGEPPAAALPQLAAVQLPGSQTVGKHSEEVADQPGAAPQPGQLRQEAPQQQAEEDG